jgi:hypothetical protein
MDGMGGSALTPKIMRSKKHEKAIHIRCTELGDTATSRLGDLRIPAAEYSDIETGQSLYGSFRRHGIGYCDWPDLGKVLNRANVGE